MKKNLFNPISLLLAILLFVQGFVSAQNAPVTTISNADGCPGDTLTFQVSVSNFSQITAISLRIDFDPSKLTFVSLTDVNPVLNGSLNNTVNVSASLSKTLFIWSDMNPATLGNGAVLFELHYILNQGNPQLMFNNSDNLGGDCEYADAVGDPLNDLPSSSYFVNGSTTNNAPVAPAWIAASDSSFCAGSTGIQLWTQEIANAEGYNWTLPAGALISGNQTNDTVIVHFAANAVSGDVTVAATNQCGTGPSATPLPLVVYPLPVASTVNGPVFPCQGTTKTFWAWNPMGGIVTHQWEYPSGWTLVMGGNGTDSLRVTFDNTAGYVKFTPENNCGFGPSDSVMVTPSLLPLQPTPIVGDTLPCVGTQVVYSVTQATNSYWWNVPAGWVITAGQSTHSITVDVGNSQGIIEVMASNGCGTASRSRAVWPRTVPEQPSVITGDTNPCFNSPQTYSIDSVAGTSYAWVVPTGWSLWGQGSRDIDVITGANGGNITVTPSNVCGDGSSRSLAISVNHVPAQPDSVYGEANPCQGTSQSYWVNQLPGVSYMWNVPSDWNITFGAGTDSIAVTIGATSGLVQATPSNICGQGLARGTQVTPVLLPVQPSIITGDTFPCQGASSVYSVNNLQGTSYTWQVPADWTIVSGQGSNTLTALAGTQPGYLTATPSNGCGNGPARSLHCSLNTVPAQPGVIVGNSNPCSGATETYYVSHNDGVVHNWSLPTGWILLNGQGSDTLTVQTTANGGNLTATPSNICGSGTPQNLAITIKPLPSQPSAISGLTSPCQGSTQSYFVTAVTGTTYTWSVPNGSSVVSGQGTSTVSVLLTSTLHFDWFCNNQKNNCI